MKNNKQEVFSIILDYVKCANILIVDDIPANVELLQRLLTISGYTNIRTETDSRKVLNIYQDEKPDLLLLDLRMPHLDGFQLLDRLQEESHEDYLPVVVITAQDDQEHRLKALHKGAKDFITKPFNHAEVLMRIRNMLEIRLLHKEVREQNRNLEIKVQERTKELQELQVELIDRLAKAAEFRDSNTGTHIIRMSLYSYELGKAVGLSDRECKLLLHASRMHDVGKIGIPDDILLKPSKLSSDEWDKMKTHAAKGAEILTGSHSEMLQMAEVIAMTHHERWDGTGYPRGLKGDEIPLVGRIVAICDVFDALVSERPYKNAWTIEDAIKELEKSQGTHFDPKLVTAFLRILPVITKIKEQVS